MSTIHVRLPDSLHASVRALAAKEEVSVNQLVTLALAEKIAALMTEDHLRKRARRGTRQKFRRAMSKVADIEPEARDRAA